MLFFMNDYGQGAHPKVLKALEETNFENTCGYGDDPYCEKAADTVRELIGKPNAHVHFMVSGTPTNVITIAQLLKPWQGVIAPKTGHIYRHETGAVEATGHRVIIQPTEDGKLTVDMIDGLVKEFEDEHTVFPKMVYISNTTELGTIYSKAELTAISEYCHSHDLYLYLDGARLGAALTAPGNDLTIQDIANLVDVFYIGGTKNGILMGEALIFVNEALDKDFRFMMKQHNNMLAKGRLLGVQFQALLEGGENSIFFEMAQHENDMANYLKDELAKKGYEFVGNSVTNQIFPIVTMEQHEMLQQKVFYEVWKQIDDEHISIRFCTGFGTTKEEIDELLELL